LVAFNHLGTISEIFHFNFIMNFIMLITSANAGQNATVCFGNHKTASDQFQNDRNATVSFGNDKNCHCFSAF